MLRSIAAHFNNNFGSNITHVANAYSPSEDEWIWICFHTEQLSSEIINLATSTEHNVSMWSNWKNVTHYELMRVPYRQVHRQQRFKAWECLTVISHDGKLLTSNYVIEANRSFIVTKHGGIKPQMYGGNLWVDTSGRNHYPQADIGQIQLQQVQALMGNGNAQGMAQTRSDRFVSHAISDLQAANTNPIYGYQHLPIETLEKTAEKLVNVVPGITNYASRAKDDCNRNSTLLTHDESAAIYLYSMPTPFYSYLNAALRAKNREALKPWFSFLKLFLSALEKLPAFAATVIWRGVAQNVGSAFVANTMQTWWSVNSCSTDLKIVQCYLGEKEGTVFAIVAMNAKDISDYSAIKDEHEVVLMCGTRLHIKCGPLSFQDSLSIVQLEEKESKEGERV